LGFYYRIPEVEVHSAAQKFNVNFGESP